MKYDNVSENFKKYLITQGRSQSYAYYIKQFLNYLNQNNIEYDNLTYVNLTDFFYVCRTKGLIKKKYGIGNINCFVKAIKCFYTYLDMSEININKSLIHVLKLKLEIEPKKIREFITIKDLELLISRSVGLYNSMRSPKQIALLNFMFFTGVRPNELFTMKREDINLDKAFVIVRIPTKSNKERIVFFPHRISKIINSYFVTDTEELNAFNITPAILQVFFFNLKQICPREINIMPYTFRRSFAQMLFMKNMDIAFIQKLMGHSNIDTTLRYLNLTIDMIEKDYRKKVK